MILNSIVDYIGNTPLLKIPEEVHGVQNVTLYAKCELFNPLGSVKDRTALGLLKEHIDILKNNGKTFVESSSGNTAKAMQVILSMNGIKFKTITNRIRAPEIRDILLSLGTDMDEMNGRSECPDPTDPENPITLAEKLVAQHPEKYYRNSQYFSLDNPKIHRTTGKEIYEDIGVPDYFFGMLGTTGSTRGISEFLLEKDSKMKAVGIITERGNELPGVRVADEMYEVGIFDRKRYSDIVEVNEDEAILSMVRLNRRCGLLCGPTTGGSFAATVAYLKKIKPTKPTTAVFIACDRMEWYMSFLKKKMPELFAEKKKFGLSSLGLEDMKYASMIKVENVKEWISKNAPVIIDLRGNSAFKLSHISGAINIVDNVFEEVVQYAPPFSNEQKVLLICPVGQKSRQFSALLYKKGFVAYSLEGGFRSYVEAGGETESYNTCPLDTDLLASNRQD